MGLIEDCKTFFGSKDLYDVLCVDKLATEDEIKRAYRKLSHKYHPDRVDDDDEKEEATKKFQVLSKVHMTLSSEEKRSMYDTNGVVLGEDGDANEANWEEYWRCLFPKIAEDDIETYLESYLGSEEEKEDLKACYMKHEGDRNKIYECMIGYEEDHITDLIELMIDEKELPEFDAFVNEPAAKKKKRLAKVAREAKEAEKEAKKRAAKRKDSDDDDSLVKAIQSRAPTQLNSMIAALEARYANEKPKKKATRKK